jgi:tRNA-dihydrouridine synthase B
MIGRGAYGRPWIFEEIKHFQKHVGQKFEVKMNEKKNIILEHLNLSLEHYGSDIGLKSFRKHLGWYSKSLKNSNEFRYKINNCNDKKIVEKYIKDFFKSL